MSKLILPIICILFVPGCSERAPATPEQPPEELYSLGGENVDKRYRDVVKTFSSLEEVSSFVRRGADLTLYEGFPHDIWESKAYEKEKQEANIVEIDKTPFYAEPIPMPAQSVMELKTLMASRSSFVPFRGPKPCGGFHADWCLSFKNGDQKYNAFLCFGCHELMVYRDGQRILYCDIWDVERFKRILDPLHIYRPTEKRVD